MKNFPKVAVLGNPNCGKTAIFNLLTGLNQKVSNYPGITVEKKNSKVNLKRGLSFHLEDYPGSYSIVSQSIDEKVVSDSIYDWIRQPELKPDAIIYVLDINNIRRNLYFCSQLLELQIPIIILLNMVDIVDTENEIDHIKLKEKLNVYSVIPFSAMTYEGLDNLKDALDNLFNSPDILTENSIK